MNLWITVNERAKKNWQNLFNKLEKKNDLNSSKYAFQKLYMHNSLHTPILIRLKWLYIYIYIYSNCKHESV